MEVLCEERIFFFYQLQSNLCLAFSLTAWDTGMESNEGRNVVEEAILAERMNTRNL